MSMMPAPGFRRSTSITRRLIEETKGLQNLSMQKELVEDSVITEMLQNKILSFRDILDLPPWNGSASFVELIMNTVKELQKLYPKCSSCALISGLGHDSIHQVLIHFYKALKNVGELWAEDCDNSENLEIEDIDIKNIKHLGRKVLERLDSVISEDSKLLNQMDESAIASVLEVQHSKLVACAVSPCTPTSVLPEASKGSGSEKLKNVTYLHPFVRPLRLQAVGKLKPMDIKRLSFHMFPAVSDQSSQPAKQTSRRAGELMDYPESPTSIEGSLQSNATVNDGSHGYDSSEDTLPATPTLSSSKGIPNARPVHPSSSSSPPLSPTPLRKVAMQPQIQHIVPESSEGTTWMLPPIFLPRLQLGDPSLQCSNSPIHTPPPSPMTPSFMLLKEVSMYTTLTFDKRMPMQTALEVITEDNGNGNGGNRPDEAIVPSSLSTSCTASQSLPSPFESTPLHPPPSKPHLLLPRLQLGYPSLQCPNLPTHTPPPSPMTPSTMQKEVAMYTKLPFDQQMPMEAVLEAITEDNGNGNGGNRTDEATVPSSTSTSFTLSQSRPSPFEPVPLQPPPSKPQLLLPAPPSQIPPIKDDVPSARSPLLPQPISCAPSAPPPPPPLSPLGCAPSAPPPSPPLPPLPPPPLVGGAAAATPPLPPPVGGAPAAPLPLMLSQKGFAPPPPPPSLGAGKALRAKKSNTKLKRSTQMGSLYRLLKGKVEGSSLERKTSNGRRGQVGASSGGGNAQGMADALAEMTKRSAYFRQIEEDVENHATSIIEMKSAIESFEAKDMCKLIKFHQDVEKCLEILTDETQVLARFEGFPAKKLEAIRVATALFVKLEAMATKLKKWKMTKPISQQLDKIENYFNKIKDEVDALERTKDQESKVFRGHNIDFDFGVLIRIKELMVDLSSNCIEMVLKESKEAKAMDVTESKSYILSKILWRAFQLAFRVYNFAGGQDDRADKLTSELAHEIETCPQF